MCNPLAIILLLTSLAIVSLPARAESTTGATPVIKSLLPNSCIQPGTRLIISGRNFTKNLQPALYSQQQLLPLSTVKVTDTQVTAIVKTQTELPAGYRYSLVFIEPATGKLLYRTTFSVITCSASVRTYINDKVTDSQQEEPAMMDIPRFSPAQGGSLLGSGIPVPSDIPEHNIEKKTDFEKQELMVISPDKAAQLKLDNIIREQGYRLKRRKSLKNLGFTLSVIAIPKDQDVPFALQQLRETDPKLLLDANHRYQLQADNSHPSFQTLKSIGWDRVTTGCGKSIRIGILDSLVDTSYPGFITANINNHSLLGFRDKPAGTQHATAIASIIATQPGHPVTGLLPGAKLFIAGVFREHKDHSVDTNAELIIRGFDWLLGQRVDAINLSIAGPYNALLELAIRRSLKNSLLLAASVGNEALEDMKRYPAAFNEVVAVTAIDAMNRLYKQANRGSFVTISAPGVDIWTARSATDLAYVSGTSYATAYVTAALAALRKQYPGLSREKIYTQLIENARDLGKPGHDPEFGYGLLNFNGCS